MARFGDKGQLVTLVGNEKIPLRSPDGGAKVGGGVIVAGADADTTPDQLVDYVLASLPSGNAVIGVQFLADTSSAADADPGAGNVRWNHATQGSATVLYVDDASADGVSLTAIWPRLNAGAVVFLQHATDPDTWQIWEVTAVNDASGYAKLTVTLWADGGSFADNDPILLTIDKGQSTGSSTEAVTALSISSGAITLDFAGKSRASFTLALTANVTTVNFSNLAGAGLVTEFDLQITQDATGGRTFALPAALKALGGSDTAIASAANAVTILSAKTFDNGTTWPYAMQERA